jgi:hypothetical protein
MNLMLLAALIGGFAWLIIHGLSRTKQIESFLIFELIVVCLGWIGFNNFHLLTILRFVLLIFAIQLIRKISWDKGRFLSLISVLTLSAILGFILLNQTKKLFFILALGYDNSSHVAFLYRTWISGKFEYGIGGYENNLVPYSNLYNAYPSLQMETWATIIKLSGFNIDTTGELIGSYSLLLISTIVILTLAILSFSESQQKKRLYFNSITTVLFLVGGTFSAVIWSGFPPTIWGILVATLVFRFFLLEEGSANHKILTITLGLVVLLYSYQIFFFPFLVLLPLAMYGKRKELNFEKIYRDLFLLAFLISLGTLFMLKTLKIKSYTFALGGIPFPAPILFFGLLALLVTLSLGSLARKSKRNTELVLLSSVLVFGGMLTVYGKISDRGSYYPIKVLYLFLTLMLCYVIYLIANETKWKSSKSRNSRFTPMLLIFVLFLDLVYGQTYKFAFGGSSANIIREWKLVQKGDYSPFGNKCLDQVFQGANRSSYFGYKEKIHLSYVPGTGWQTDLLSRWSNSLQGRIDDLVLELTIPMGSSKNQSEVIESFKVKYPDLDVLPIDMTKSNACSY